ncbi:hypothetical protein ACTMU2_10630 [Cupriavidus basilensis]
MLIVAGEGAFDMRYQRTLRAFVKVLEQGWRQNMRCSAAWKRIPAM